MEGNEQYQKEQEVVFKASDRICALHYLSLHEVRLIIGLEESFLILNIDTYDVIFKFDFKSVAMAAESSIGLNDSIVMQTAGSYGFCRNQIITCNTMSNDISIIHLSESFTNRESNIQEILAPTDAIYPLPSDTIETYIKRIVESKNSGIWAKKVHQTCLIQLAIINITSIDKLLQNKTIKQLEIIKEFPAFVLSNLRLNIGQCEYLEKQSSFEALDDDIIDQNSFLNMITIKKTTSTPSKSPFKLNHKLDLMHQPISFRSKVKSSGYSSSPQNTRMFHRPVVAKKTEKKSILPEGKTLSHCYFESSIPIKFTTDKMTHNAPVMCVKYNPSGSLFATSSADKTARIYGSKIKSFSHSSPVSDISWAVNYVPDFGHLFMTIDSANSFVKLWSNEKSDPLLTLGEQTQSKTKYHRIKGMKFFNRDRLIVLSRGPNLQFVTFNIEKSDPSLLQPNLKLSNSTRVIGTLTDVGESTISAFSCINTANSHLVISATSDKKISIWDVNVGKIVRCNENSMKRSIHTISIGDYYNLCNFPETKNIGDDDSSKIGSTTGYGSSQHIFATAAVTDSIKLWDVRKCEAVLHLHGHVNRVGSIGVSMSPCGRYVLTGSEDNQAYVYDIRKASVLCKLSGAHSDIVTSVDFNPVKSEMITGSHDCKIKIWKS